MKGFKVLFALSSVVASGQVFSTQAQNETQIPYREYLKQTAAKMYSGQERNVHTYVYLYKVPHSENYTDGGCSCNSCDIRKDGLGVGIITTEGELSEMDENSIKIIW